MPRWISKSLIVLVATAGTGCGGNSTALSPTQPTPPPPPVSAVQPTLSSIQANVFSTRCVSCHSGATPEAGLRLTAGETYANLVNVPSTQRNIMRVAPNNAANSYLIHKLDGRADIFGHQMPPPPALSSEVVQAIRQWIDQGAQNN